MSDMSNVKVGEKVVLERTDGSLFLEQVHSVTPSSFRLRGGAGLYRKSDGYERGRPQYYKEYVQPLTPELLERIEAQKAERARRALARIISELDWGKMSMRLLLDVQALVRGGTE